MPHLLFFIYWVYIVFKSASLWVSSIERAKFDNYCEHCFFIARVFIADMLAVNFIYDLMC